MATISIDIPDSLHNRIQLLTTKDGYSLNQFLVCAAAEKLSSIATIDYLRERASGADIAEFDRIMERIPNVPPDAGDELP